MNPERNQFLNLNNIPARLNAQQAAWFLGFATKEIPHLTKARLLKPLGKPERFTTKYYSTARLRRLREDEAWLDKASATIFKFWRQVNGQRDMGEAE